MLIKSEETLTMIALLDNTVRKMDRLSPTPPPTGSAGGMEMALSLHSSSISLASSLTHVASLAAVVLSSNRRKYERLLRARTMRRVLYAPPFGRRAYTGTGCTGGLN